MDIWAKSELLKDLKARAKAGDVETVYNRLGSLCTDVDVREKHELATSYGWIIFYCLKYLDNFTEESAEWLLRSYFYVIQGIERPSRLHTQILEQAAIVAKKFAGFNYLDFLENWLQQGRFREEDWKEVTKDKKVFKPAVVKPISVFFKRFGKIGELTESKLKELYHMAAYSFLLDYFDNHQIEDITYETSGRLLAKIAIVCKGEKNEFYTRYRKLLKLQPKKPYLWGELAEGLEGELRLSALCKSLSLYPEEKFRGKLHCELAEVLLGLGRAGEALSELEIADQFYRAEGWSTQKIDNVRKLIPSGTCSHSIGDYSVMANLAEEWLWSDVPEVTVSFCRIFEKGRNPAKGKKGSNQRSVGVLASLDQKEVKFRLDKHSIRKEDMGKLYSVRVLEKENGKTSVISLKPSSLSPSEWVKGILPLRVVVKSTDEKGYCWFVTNKGEEYRSRRISALSIGAGELLHVWGYVQEIKEGRREFVAFYVEKFNGEDATLRKTIKGVLRTQPDKNREIIGFIKNCFISPSLIGNHINGENITCVAIPNLRPDGELGWRSVRIVEDNKPQV